MLATTTSSTIVDRTRLDAVIAPIARAHGADVVWVELKNESGWVLRVFVEKTGTETADLELCADISRDLSQALDVAELITFRYSLEVSSPGLERPLFGARDFERFQGRKAKVKLKHDTTYSQKVVVGLIEDVTDGKVTLSDGARKHALPLADVEKARLVFEITKGPKRK